MASQRALLAAKALPLDKLQLPDAIRNKRLALLHDPTWERVVVSPDTHLPGISLFSAPRRVCVSATTDYGGGPLAIAGVRPDGPRWTSA